MLRGIDLEIYPGELIGVVGSTGAGKSTLCLTLNGLIPHYAGGVLEGEVRVAGGDTRSTTVAELSAIVGLVFQDADSQLVMSTVEEECLLGPLSQGLTRAQARERAAHALALVEMSQLAHRSPRALSGGQKQRTAIAAVLASEPSMLVLDEATSELDALMVHKLFGFCAELNRVHGTTIVIVSHEVELLARYASRLLLVHDGAILHDSPPVEALQDRAAFEAAGVRLPQVVEVYHAMHGELDLTRPPLENDEIEGAIRRLLSSTE